MKRFVRLSLSFFMAMAVLSPSIILAEEEMEAGTESFLIYTKLGVESRYIDGKTTQKDASSPPQWTDFNFKDFMGGVNLEVGSLYDEGIYDGLVGSRLNITFLKALKGSERDAEVEFFATPLSTDDAVLTQGTYFDARYTYNFFLGNRLTIGPFLGYSAYNFTHDSETLALNYKIREKFPYAGLGIGVFFPKTDAMVDVSFAYSDRVAAKDTVFECDCKGSAYLAKVRSEWNVTSNWFVNLGAEYVEINTEGTDAAALDNSMDTWFWSGIVSVSYMFY